MIDDDLKNFMGYLWYRDEGDGTITIGINEEGLEDFEEILSVDLPQENDKVQTDVILGTIETDDGPLDIYSPAEGMVVEVNQNILDDPAVIMEDPYEEGWLIRIETSDTIDDEEDDDLDDDDDDEDSDEDETEDEE